MKRRSLSLAAITLLALATVPAAYSGGAETVYVENPKMLSADTIYIGGAVIIGLVVLGAILGAGFATGTRSNLTVTGSYMIIVGAIIVMAAQGIAMLHACCIFLVPPYEFTTATIGGALAIIVGFGMITTGRLVGSKGQSAQDGKTD